MKIYKVGSLTFQFEEGKQPEGAVEVKKPETKAVRPVNKSRRTRK